MVLALVVLMAVWMALTRTADVPILVAGAGCSVVVVVLWRAIAPDHVASAAPLVRHPIRAARFAVTLAQRFVVSTLRTAWLILRGGEEGRVMALPVRVSDPLARFMLLNSITLTPSTISLLTEENLLYIHWLQASDEASDWRSIKESLELRLQRLFEEPTGRDCADR